MIFLDRDARMARSAKVNKDEANVVIHPLPPATGTATTAAEFDASGKAELRKIFEKHIYGAIPPAPDKIEFVIREEKSDALDGIAIRRQIDIICSMANGKSHTLPMLLYIPKNRKNVPCFFGLNFKSNADATTEDDIPMTPCPDLGGAEYIMTPWDGSKPKLHARWSFKEVVSRGFASATIWCGSILPDAPYGIRQSAMQLFLTEEQWLAPDRPFGAISAWAWGIHRAIDALVTQPELNPERIFIHGHSRLGKTALWAGACDPRAALVISNDSGCCGAKLQRRNLGETLLQICAWFPHWFLDSLSEFAENETALPFDQHQLMAMIAPRPIAIGSATEDWNADPRGEFLATRAASEAYRLYGFAGLAADTEMPEPDVECAGPRVSYHLRTGEHDIKLADWEIYMNFALREYPGCATPLD